MIDRSAPIFQPSGFYITGGTLRGDAPSYVIRRADGEIYESLSQGQFCYVLTSRQMGKSSLMIRTATRLCENGIGVVVLDLTAVGQNLTAEQWYDGLLSRIGRQLQLEEDPEKFWTDNPRLGPLQRWMSAIDQIVLPKYPGRLVIFIDEIDTVRSLPFTTDEFFAGIREFYNRRTAEPELERLTFCLLGVASPSDLIQDTRMTPFNIGHRIELHDFTEDEARSLAAGLRSDDQTGQDLLDRVLYWTGGHPYLTQRLCRAIAEDCEVKDRSCVDRKCRELFFVRQAQEIDNNLIFVRERMLRSEVDLAGLLTFYDQVHSGMRVADDETSQLVSALRLSGITRLEKERLMVRNRIYDRIFDHDWVREHMPDAEIRRQQKAYKRGILRTSLIAGMIFLTIMALSFITFQQRNLARLQAAAHRRQLYAAQMNLAGQAWRNRDFSYFKELIENQLPEPGQEDLRGFEWYYFKRLSNTDPVTLLQPGSITSIAYSPDGKTLLTGSDYNVGKLYDIGKKREIYTLKGHTSNTILSVAYSPDGKMTAIAGVDGVVKIFEAATGCELYTLFGHLSSIRSVAFSPDSQLIASGSLDGSVILWSAGRIIHTFSWKTAGINAIAFSPDGAKLSVGRNDSIAEVWDISTKRKMLNLEGHKSGITSIAFTSDGNMIVTGSADKTAIVWNALTGRILHILSGHSAEVSSLSISPNGRTLATAGLDNRIVLWDISSGTQLRILKGHVGTVRAVAFSPDGKALASGSKDSTLKIWDLTRKQEPLVLISQLKNRTVRKDYSNHPSIGSEVRGSIANAAGMAFSPDGKFLATSSMDGTAKLWEISSGNELHTLKGHSGPIRSIALSHDGERLVTGSFDHTAKLWDLKSGRELLTFKGHSARIHSVAISPDGKLLATGSADRTLKLWDINTGIEIDTLRGHTGNVWSVAFMPDNTKLVTGSMDANAIIWDYAHNKKLMILTGHFAGITSAAFSQNGKMLATASGDRSAKLWDAATGRSRCSLRGHTDWVMSVGFSPDGRRLVTGSYDKTVRIWDTHTCQLLTTIEEHETGVETAGFSPDGRALVIGYKDGTIILCHAASASKL